MKNLKQLCLFLSAGTIAALSIGACSDDTPIPSGTAGTGTAGTGTAGTGTAGTGTAGTGTAGTGTAGTGTAGTATAGTGTGGTGTAGTASGGSGGSGGASGGSGGRGGAGGSGGASGGSGGASGGSGGSGGGSGGASAACTKWCVGADSVLTVCANNNIPTKINSEQKCLDVCKTAPGASVTCWNTHTANAKTGDKGVHCPHAEGAPGNGMCPELP